MSFLLFEFVQVETKTKNFITSLSRFAPESHYLYSLVRFLYVHFDFDMRIHSPAFFFFYTSCVML